MTISIDAQSTTRGSIPALVLTLLLAATPTLQAQNAPKPGTPAPAKPQAPAKEKGAGSFIEGRHGNVPEGAADQVTDETERTIELGLTWLSKQQNADGSFGVGSYKGNIAVTSLSGLAFMAAGSSPGRGPYGSHIDKALVYVMDNASPSGFIAVHSTATSGPMYSHGFGTLFLAEAYGMTRRPELREKLQKAVRLIIDTQNNEGGWRYQPVKSDADLSVTICQINALRAARNAGIYVPKETVEACIKYVKQTQNSDGGFRYMTQAGPSAFPRSAAGIVALYSAAEYEGKEIESGIAYLKQFMP
jgi:prenyltransferase beta subunit